jgi:hypothetical protein
MVLRCHASHDIASGDRTLVGDTVSSADGGTEVTWSLGIFHLFNGESAASLV